MFETYSTRLRPGDGRLDYWNEIIAQRFPGMTVSAGRTIDAQWTQCWLGEVGLARACSQKAVVSRWLDAMPDAASGRVLVHLQNAGFSRTEQRHGAAVLGQGELTLCIPDEPYRIDLSERNDMFVLDCPGSALNELISKDNKPRVIDRSIPASGLLRDFAASLFRQHWRQPPDAAEGAVLGGMLIHLLRQALSGEAPLGSEPNRREQVLRFIEAHLGDSGLRTSVIAERLSLSVRSVQNIFAEMATTPTAYLTDRRLTLAMEKIRGPEDHGTLTDLALDLGFCDSAHFARRFRARFGMPPREFAHRCRQLN